MKLLCALALMAYCACGRAASIGEWADGDGTKITWSPARPEIGDLVKVTVVTAPQAKLPADEGAVLSAPEGRSLAPLSLSYAARNVSARWSFRIEAAGEYRWGDRTLWSVKSAAGNETELKTFDPQSLWDGRAQSAASPAPGKNARPAPAPGAPTQGLPAPVPPAAVIPQNTPGGSI